MKERRAKKILYNLNLMDQRVKKMKGSHPSSQKETECDISMYDDCHFQECGFSDQIASCTIDTENQFMDEYETLFKLQDIHLAETVFDSKLNTIDERAELELLHSYSNLWEEKISPNLPYSIYEAYTLILFFIVQQGISRAKVDSLLNLLQGFLPAGNKLATSKHQFFKVFSSHLPMKKIYFCREHRLVCGTCESCQKDCKMESFLWCDPIQQFINRLKADERFYNLAQHYRLKRSNRHSRTSDDVYAGTVYQSIAAPITNVRGGYSFLLNYDGASKWKSSQKSAIPIYMICNELPFQERFKVENVIFCGVWFGSKKPETNILFSVLIDDLIQAEKGIESKDPYGNPLTIRLRCINTCCDLPAKAALFYQQQHGGRGACYFCNNQGCKIGTRFCYPLIQAYKELKVDHSARTDQQVQEIYNTYDELRKINSRAILPVRGGLNGISDFRRLKYWSWTKCGSIDFMHLLMGIFSTLMKLWMRPDFNNNRARVSVENWSNFDQLLCSQKIPKVFHRNLRSIVDHHKYWKASECMVFLLYTSRLTKFLFPPNTPYFEHHMVLVESLYRLLKRGQTKEELDSIERQLVIYLKNFQEIYDEKYVTLNFHLLSHLVQCVRMHGPLVCYSAFPFESYNHMLMRSIHGTHRVEQGLCQAIPLFQHLQERLNRTVGEEAKKVLKGMKARCLTPKGALLVDNVQLFKKRNCGSEYGALRVTHLWVEASESSKNKKQDNSMVRLSDQRDNSSVCSGRGVCSGVDVCLCNPGYSGSNCEKEARGIAYSIGQQSNGVLANDDVPSVGYSQTPLLVGGLLTKVMVTKVDGGSYFSIALSQVGDLYSWGSINNNDRPQKISSNVLDCCASVGRVVAIKKDGTVQTWGTYGHTTSPLFDTGEIPKSVACGAYHTLILTNLGTVYSFAQKVLGLTNIAQVAAGDYHSLALGTYGESSLAVTNKDQVYSWGSNTNGILGDSSAGTSRSLPGLVKNIVHFKAMYPSKSNSWVTGINETSGEYSWGINTFSQLGDKSTTTRLQPVKQVVNENYPSTYLVGVGAGSTHSLLLLNGTICYGILADDELVCNWRGTCVDEDRCACDSGYYGNECELTTC